MKKTYFILSMLLLFYSCDLSTPPNKKLTPCETFLWCLYINQNNPDKTICSDSSKYCKKSSAFYDCVKNKDSIDFEKCLSHMKD